MMAADETVRRLVHRPGIERWRDMPGAAALEGEWGATIDDAIEICPAARRAPCIEIVGRRRDGQDGDPDRLDMVGEGALDLVGPGIAREIETGALAQRAHTGIRAAR